MFGHLFRGVGVVVTVPYQVAARWAVNYYMAMGLFIMALTVAYYIADTVQYHTDRVGWYLDHPEARLRDHYQIPEKELTKRFGPHTDVTADGQMCMSGRCEGGYATLADYHKANDAKDAEFAANYEKQRQARAAALAAQEGK